MRILYLYAEVMGYNIPIFSNLVDKGFDVHVVHWDHRKLSKYRVPSLDNVSFYNRSQYSTRGLIRLCKSLDPGLIVVSGWQDLAYLFLLFLADKSKVSVVTCFDDQWKGGIKQNMAAILGRFGVFHLFYTHAWVSGPSQYEYARRLGFDKNAIRFDLLSADVNLFASFYDSTRVIKKNDYPHRFLYVGRFEEEKGLLTLLDAWESLGYSKHDWELCLIGNGCLKQMLEERDDIIVKDFVQPKELRDEILCSGCLILPSIDEPWGVVVHEFASAGLPLILSNCVGAREVFLINEYNGYVFDAGDQYSLLVAMQRMVGMSDNGLVLMSELSHKLSERISPETSCMNLVSLT